MKIISTVEMYNLREKKVAIIDFGLGNLFSVVQACKNVGLNTVITNDKDFIINCDAAILPGVGAFGTAMKNLQSLDLVDVIKKVIDNGKPFMGICLGMQLLMSISFEFGETKGFDIFKGEVVKFPSTLNQTKIKIPQVGWNRIKKRENNSSKWRQSCLKDLNDGEFLYFVHSFYVIPRDATVELSTSEYEGITYCSSIAERNVFACQFHPERSGKRGLIIYKNFANSIINDGKA